MISEIEIIDIKAINKTIKESYGFDFSEYATTSYKRRIAQACHDLKINSVELLINKIATDKSFFDQFCKQLVVETTELFRDPSFWRKLREEVFPNFSSHQTIRIWVAGCASGEEVLSLAILLKEANLYEKTKIIATEVNQLAIDIASKASYPSKSLEIATSNYERFEGEKTLKDYYKENNGTVQYNTDLFTNVTFKSKFLDGTSIGKFDLILSRNVFIYYSSITQEIILGSFIDSLMPYGFLAIGVKESIKGSKHFHNLSEFSADEKIYRKQK